MDTESQLIEIADFLKDNNEAVAHKYAERLDCQIQVVRIDIVPHEVGFIAIHVPDSNTWVTSSNCTFIYKRSYPRNRMIPVGLLDLTNNTATLMYLARTENKTVVTKKPNLVSISTYYPGFYTYSGERKSVSRLTSYNFSEGYALSQPSNVIVQHDIEPDEILITFPTNKSNHIGISRKFYQVYIRETSLDDKYVMGYSVGTEEGDPADLLLVPYDQDKDISSVEKLEKLYSK